MTDWRITEFGELNKRQFNLIADNLMACKGMDHPYPGLEVIIHIQAGTGDLHLIKPFGSGER